MVFLLSPEGESVSCVQDLDMIWESECANWAGAGEAAMEQAEPVHQQTPELSPEQLRLISAHFDKVSLSAAMQPLSGFMP